MKQIDSSNFKQLNYNNQSKSQDKLEVNESFVGAPG